jgi:hypothetical protein
MRTKAQEERRAARGKKSPAKKETSESSQKRPQRIKIGAHVTLDRKKIKKIEEFEVNSIDPAILQELIANRKKIIFFLENDSSTLGGVFLGETAGRRWYVTVRVDLSPNQSLKAIFSESELDEITECQKG